MKKNWTILICFLLFSFGSRAENSVVSTTFDDRPICEQQKGVWREYGNGCVDECESKFDQFTICTSAITYGCDCGKGRCWNEKSCVPVAVYKKTFDKKFEEEQKLLQEAKKKRQGEYQENTTTIVNDLIAKKQNTPASPDVAGSIKNNYDQFYQKNIDPAITGITNVTDNTISQVNKNLEKSGQNQLPQISIAPTPEAVPVAPPIVIDNNDKAQIPAMFLEQEKAKQLLQQQTSNNQQAPATNNASQLPIIPLP
jgi:hypothetical protein